MQTDAIKNKSDIDNVKRYLKERNERHYLFFTLGINTGLRISDLLELKVSTLEQWLKLGANVPFEFQEIKIQKMREKLRAQGKKPKGKATRTLVINDTAYKAIKGFIKWLKDSGQYDSNQYVVLSRKGDNKPITRQHAYAVLNEAIEATCSHLNITVGTHTMRKCWGYWAYKGGADLTQIQKAFNHSSQAITLDYIGITKDDIANIYGIVNL